MQKANQEALIGDVIHKRNFECNEFLERDKMSKRPRLESFSDVTVDGEMISDDTSAIWSRVQVMASKSICGFRGQWKQRKAVVEEHMRGG